MMNFLSHFFAYVSNDVSLPANLFICQVQMLQQWLKVPSSDILVCFYVSLYRIEQLVMLNTIELFDWYFCLQVVLSQGGSNRQGFTIVPSNVKDRIHFDALFNIISYDMVPKLQDVLMASDFKVILKRYATKQNFLSSFSLLTLFEFLSYIGENIFGFNAPRLYSFRL